MKTYSEILHKAQSLTVEDLEDLIEDLQTILDDLIENAPYENTPWDEYKKEEIRSINAK